MIELRQVQDKDEWAVLKRSQWQVKRLAWLVRHHEDSWEVWPAHGYGLPTSQLFESKEAAMEYILEKLT